LAGSDTTTSSLAEIIQSVGEDLEEGRSADTAAVAEQKATNVSDVLCYCLSMVSQISLRAVCGSVALLSPIFFSHICTVCNPKPLNKCRISQGTLFYSYYYQWPLPQSFFYAVDAGMSIGFCTDVAETKVASRAFTIVHILLGASCVGGALVLMVQSALEGVASRSSAVYRLILERDSLKRAFLAGGASDNLPSSMQQVLVYPKNWVSRRVWRRERDVLSYDDFREVLKSNGLKVTNREFQHVYNFYDPGGEGCIRYDYFASHFQGIHRILPASRLFVYYNNSRLLPMRALVRAWDASTSLFTNENHRIYLLFLLWVGMGITWGIFSQGWDPITATHFAVSALATGGLTAPPVDPSTGIMPASSALFCGFYCLFGIPLMALTLGIFARVLVEGYIVEEELVAIARPLSPSEYRFASKSLCSTDNSIHLSDYIVLQLMRQGKLSLESFEFMKRQYQTLDQYQLFRLRGIDPD
jgi:hypothetical protein